MMEKERVRRYIDKIDHIKERSEDINRWMRETDTKENIDKKTRLAIYKAMQEIVEASTDILAMILKDEGKLPKDDYTNINILYEHGVIDKKLKETLNEANGLRNRLIHEYNGLNPEIAFISIEKLLPHTETFIDVVTEWLKRALDR